MNRIRELRLRNHWRQEDLAARLSTKKNTVSRYETEKLGLEAKTICKLCDIFGVTADYLLCRSSVPTPAISEEDAALLRAYHAADARSRAAIDALLAPLPQEESRSAG